MIGYEESVLAQSWLWVVAKWARSSCLEKRGWKGERVMASDVSHLIVEKYQ